MQPLDPAVRTVWTLQLALFFAVVLLGAFAFDLARFLGGREGFPPPGLASVAVLLVGLLFAFGLPRLRYRAWRYALDDEELYLERGVLNRVRTIVPLRRIQHLDVSQNLVEREFGLGKLVVHTAGARSSDVVLPGLRYEEAVAMRDVVKRYILAEEA